MTEEAKRDEIRIEAIFNARRGADALCNQDTDVSVTMVAFEPPPWETGDT
jgi:hypothetical protein